MASVRDLGFSPFEEGYQERGEAIAAELDAQQLVALRELETYRREYFADLREFARRKIEAGLLICEEEGLDPAATLAVGMADLALRMSNKFQLQMVEIIMFGKRQGELPPLESTRIL